MATYLEETTFKHGATTYPLTSATTNTLLKDTDPAIYHASLYFSTMLEYHIGARFVAEAAKTSYKQPNGTAIAKAVGSVLPFDPEPYLLDEYLTFPVFAMYRSEDIHDDRTIELRETQSTWHVDYVLPPFNAAQAECMVPILSTIGRILDYVLYEGGDSNYQNGQRIWEQCDVTRRYFTRGEFGRWQPKSNLVFHAWHGTLEVSENRGYVTTAFETMADFDEWDVQVQVKVPGQTPVSP